ncbi:glycoside hydrolase family 108 protein [Pararhizobium haloflavum]|uniref:glycoside hydrolase family 108 protein n=1 Tax=Pararhizobium haloflavum TaxID=2037914 RepID=UPI000C190B94|nr:glycosyl hydrolase 108 family protein [Pararhizobium haloflavum]
MHGNFENCLAVTLGYEGGWADHPSDPGGATMKGITLATYRRYRPNATRTQLRNIPQEDVARIYRTGYWDTVGGDRLAAGVDLATFDAGVNSGPSRARKWLMSAIGGPDHETVQKLCAKRLGFMRSLAIWKTFGRGWSRRVANIEAKGVAWALAKSTGRQTAREELVKQAKAAKSKASNQAAGAGASGATTTAGGGDVLINPQHADQIAGWVLSVIVAAGAFLVFILIVRAIVHKQRASAYAAEAERIML